MPPRPARAEGQPASGADKLCARCEIVKPAAMFGIDRRRKDGLFPYCASCRLLWRKSRGTSQDCSAPLNGNKCLLCLEPCRGHKNRLFCSDYCKGRAGTVTKHFNLTLPEYRALLDDCGGRCPICRCNMLKQPIDHNHETLEVTGIVCTRCNIGLLAFSNHDPEVIRRLLEFLLNPPARRVTGRAVTVNPAYFKKSQAQTMWGRKPRR